MKVSLKVAAAVSLIMSFTFYIGTLFMPDSYGMFVYFIPIVLFAVSTNLGSRVVVISRYFIVNLIIVSIVTGVVVSAIAEINTLAGGAKFESTNPLFVIMIAEFYMGVPILVASIIFRIFMRDQIIAKLFFGNS